MTGFGEAHWSSPEVTVAIEIKTVNHRFFKLSFKCPEGYNLLESDIESTIRNQVVRGSVLVVLKIDRAKKADDYKLNTTALASYRQQLESFQKENHIEEPIGWDVLLPLPGVVLEQRTDPDDISKEWAIVQPVLKEAVEKLTQMRHAEGKALTKDLLSNLEQMRESLASIEKNAPIVAEEYRKRITERVDSILKDYDLSLGPADLLREVSIFTERCDISEETVRLHSHLKQFQKIMDAAESSGKKLDFLTQEMFRETNTIGSKANNVEISNQVVEMKATIEKIREMVQNLE